MTYVPAKKPVNKKPVKKAPPWEAWNRAHPELVCSDANCPHNRQSIERRRTKSWQFMHHLSHGGPTAFSARTLAVLADCPVSEAEECIDAGVHHRLIMHVSQTADGPTYSRFAKPEGKKATPAGARRAKAFGQASATLWGTSA